ncbi:apolipoprotein N-acyltransferase [Synechocystis salina]|uniref:Apolipoprotein N-acyltransferase n=1 Tax=Synechocystis salina LEGE 00031 TaxID=1828736 RepID=A0ABR9VYP2_9SYNC|nr:apolipoprotein N-acyltransferase [Synechocystis salina]MBE9242299.1 apolipoprotein N-acyltransferase [Synechocystis salina LEGE 00041]MBE9255488.1 apolipoprotein N-acyltransferase [Synechocystis salina LEGE 00031]
MGLATASLGWTYAAWFGQIPLWLWVFRANPTKLNFTQLKQFLISRLITAIAWGGGFYGIALFWITGVHPLTWLGVPWLASLAIAAFCWLAITAWGIVLVWVWLLAMAACQITTARTTVNPIFRNLSFILWGTASWCTLEILWSHSILWWSPVAYTQSPSQLHFLQWGALGGPALLTAFIVAINGLLALGLTNSLDTKTTNNDGRIWPYLFLAMVMWLGCQGGGWLLYQKPLADVPEQSINVGIIQGNIPNQIKFNSEGWRRAIAGYTEGYEKLAGQGVDIVLTPEGALPYLWETVVARSGFYQAILQTQVPVWLGAYGTKGDGYTNSLFTIDSQGQLRGRYDKVKLVPLGEYIPLSNVLGQLIQRLSPLKEQLLPGDRPQVLPTPFGPAAVVICYESAFPHLLRAQLLQGGEFILSSANNAHYSDTMAAQHHALDVMRAIEGDRWLARATNTGLSAIINPRGETLWLSAMNQYQIHAAPIYRRQHLSPYSRWGDWLVVLLLILSAIAWFYSLGTRTHF